MINTDLNREISEDALPEFTIENVADSILGPVVRLHRTYVKIGHNHLGDEFPVYTRSETVDLPAFIASAIPDYGLDDDCRVIRCRIEFGDVFDQWGRSA